MSTVHIHYQANKKYGLRKVNDETTRLNFHKNNFTSIEIGLLESCLDVNEQITSLNVSQTGLGKTENFLAFLRLLLACQHIQHLNVSNNKFTTSQLYSLLRVIVQSPAPISSLNLNACGLNRCNWEKLILLFRNQPYLHTLKIKDNALSEAQGNYLLVLLKQAPHITHVEYESNHFSYRLHTKLQRQLHKNKLYLALCAAIEEDDYAKVVYCLQQDAQGNAITALAELFSDIEIVKMLVLFGAPLVDVNVNGDSLLHRAVLLGSQNMVDWLLAGYPELMTERNQQNKTPLQMARDVGATKEIIQSIHQAMHRQYLEAAASGDLKQFTQMLEIGAVHHARYESTKQTALHLAAMKGHFQIIIRLLAYPSLLPMKDTQGLSALQQAKRHHHCQCYILLHQSMLGILRQAVWEQDITQIKQLIAAGLELTTIDMENSEHPVWLAVMTGNINIFNLFLRILGEDFVIKHHKKIIQLIEDKPNELSQYIEDIIHQHDESRVVSTFNVIYSNNSAHKQVKLPLEDIHEQLRERSARVVRDAKVDTNSTTLNLVTTKVSFIVSDRAHTKGGAHGRRIITLDLPLTTGPITHVEDHYSITKHPTGPKSKQLLRDVLRTSPQRSHTVIIDKFATTQFHREFHHSERALYAHMLRTTTINQLVDSLLQYVENIQHIKVYSVVLHLHSTHSLCGPCDASLPYQYGPQSDWAQLLVSKLKERGFKVLTNTDRFAVAITVSANKPAKKSEQHDLSAAAATQDARLDINSKQKPFRTLVISQRPRHLSHTAACFFSNYSRSKLDKAIELQSRVLSCGQSAT